MYRLVSVDRHVGYLCFLLDQFFFMCHDAELRHVPYMCASHNAAYHVRPDLLEIVGRPDAAEPKFLICCMKFVETRSRFISMVVQSL